MIINTLYKTDTIIDGIKYNPPSKIFNYGQSIELTWKNQNNNLHNDNGPAIISYYPNGNISYKLWCANGKCHNENGPAYIRHDEDGNVAYKECYINDKLHNENGPAIIGYDEDGNIIRQEYWENGIRIK